MAITLNDNGYSVQIPIGPDALKLTSSAASSVLTRLANIGAGSWVQQSSGLTVPASAPFTFDFDLPAPPIQIGNFGNNAARGFQLSDVTLRYQFVGSSGNASAGASTMTFNAFTQSFTDQSTTLLNSSGSSGSSGTPYGGTFTFSAGLAGTSSTMTLAPSSVINVIACSPQSSLAPFVNTNNQRMTFEWAFNSGTGTSFQLMVYGATIHGTWLFG